MQIQRLCVLLSVSLSLLLSVSLSVLLSVSCTGGTSLKELLESRRNFKDAGDDFEDFKGQNENLFEQFQKDLQSGKVNKINPNLWWGMNESDNPEIIFLESYKGPTSFLESLSIKSLKQASEAEAEAAYFGMIESIHVLCRNVRRFGNRGDGGWNLCISSPYNLIGGCLIYSFGINFDFSFDDSLAMEFNCSVKSFDPSMSDKDHSRSDNVHFYQLGLGPLNTVTADRWVVKNLATIRRFLEHSDRVIDVLKIDIEFGEWESLVTMIHDGSLLSVKQLVFESHTRDLFRSLVENSIESYSTLFDVLSLLETKTPFRKYHYHPNSFGNFISEFSGKFLSCCHELYYINIAFLKPF